MNLKKILHAPGLILIALCGLTMALLGWDAAEEWFAARYDGLQKECQ